MSLRQTARVVILLACVQSIYNQGQPQNPADRDPTKFGEDNKSGDRTDLANVNRPQSGRLEFYMDSSSDCSGTVRETGDHQVTVFGRGATQSGASPTTCTLSLRVDQPRDPKRYRISLLDMDIRDCDVSFYIYDGTEMHSMLGRYGCPQITDTNYERLIWTSGNQVTFIIKRTSREQTRYNIRIQVQTITADTNWETWPQDTIYNRFYKFEQKWVVLIVGVCYIIITIMIILLLAICYCCIKGDRDKWQKSRFGYLNPIMTGSGTKSTLNNSKALNTSKLNSSNGTANGQPQYNGNLRKSPMNVKKRMAGGSEDIDSVFESDGTLPNKRPPQIYASRQQAPQSRGVRQRNGKPSRNFGRDPSESYVQADDDHPQNMFVEREIIIPAKKKHHYKKEEEFSSEDEELSSGGEEIEKVSSAMNTDPEMKDDGVQYSEQEQEEEEEQEESDDAESDEPEQSVVYAKPKKNRQAKKNTQPQRPTWEAQQPVTASVPNSEPHARPRTPLGDMAQYIPQYPSNGQRHPELQHSNYRQQVYAQPDYGQPDYRQPDFGAPPSAVYGYHPSEVPSQPSQHDYYPNMAPPPYQTSGRYPRYTPEPYYPVYEDNQYHPRPGVRQDPRSYPPTDSVPKDPPIYSYLVRRGYNPVDGRQSPVSSNNSLENRLGGFEESDASANLDSGVEIMRR